MSITVQAKNTLKKTRQHIFRFSEMERSRTAEGCLSLTGCCKKSYNRSPEGKVFWGNCWKRSCCHSLKQTFCWYLVRIPSGFAGLPLILPIVFLVAFFMSGLLYAISLCLPNEAIYETIMNLIVKKGTNN